MLNGNKGKRCSSYYNHYNCNYPASRFPFIPPSPRRGSSIPVGVAYNTPVRVGLHVPSISQLFKQYLYHSNCFSGAIAGHITCLVSGLANVHLTFWECVFFHPQLTDESIFKIPAETRPPWYFEPKC